MKILTQLMAGMLGLIITQSLLVPTIAGPEPDAPLVRIRVAPGPAGISIEWPEMAEYGVMIETRKSILESGPWAAAPASVWPIKGSSWTDPRLVSGSAEFYRLTAGPAVARRGQLLDSLELSPMTPSDIEKLFESVVGGSGVRVPVGVGVRLHRLVYETANPFGLRTTASGLLVIPATSSVAMPLASYQHGTILSKDEVPSAMQGLERVIGIALGTSGYVAALPDYLGLGESPGLHPFVHAKSEATATVDMLRAARVFCATNSIVLNGQVFLIGYSEGGHATMAAQREIETLHTNEFKITASAPMAGPYDLSGVTTDDFLSGRAMPNPYYFLYLLAAYQSIYHVADSLSAVLAPPYDRTLPPLLDGQHEGSELNRAIGGALPLSILKPAFLEAFRNDPNHPLRAALRKNDVYDWTPIAPTHLYHCGGDQDVVFANSQVAYDQFVSRGAKQVELVNPLPLADHGTCAPFALLAAKILWFDTLVKK